MARAFRILAAVIALIGFGWSQAHAQIPLTGAGRGAPTTAAFQGPLDLGIANIVAIWSLRCSATAYTGNVVDVWDATTGNTTETLITCSAGGVLNETVNPLATTCASGCRIKTVYDQSGALKCVGGTACDLTEATNANRPTFQTSCINSKYCGQCTGGTVDLHNASGLTAAVTQPFMVSHFSEQTANFTSFGALFGADNGAIQIGFGSTANTAFLYAGTAAPTVTASNSVFHAVQATFNGASSELYVDGSGTTTATPGANSFPASFQIDVCQIVTGGTNTLTGSFTEISMWSGGAWSSGTKSSMNANQRSSTNGWGP